jgi:hypothetical protein
MSNEIEKARQALRSMMAKEAQRFITFVAKVEAVDINKGTCQVEPVDGNPSYYGVRLVPSVDNVVDGVVPVPKVGSFVICGKLENENDVFVMVPGEVTKYIIKCSDGGVIELNGNGFSMVKGETLQTELNKLKATVQLILNAINSAVPVVDNSGAGLQTSMKAIIASAQDSDFGSILNNKVKHG